MPVDILLSEDFDLRIEAGDLVVGESTTQHQRLLLLCDKGSFKETPDRCVGVSRYVEEAGKQGLLREIDVEFSRDGMNVREIALDGSHLKIEAQYE